MPSQAINLDDKGKGALYSGNVLGNVKRPTTSQNGGIGLEVKVSALMGEADQFHDPNIDNLNSVNIRLVSIVNSPPIIHV